MTEAPQRLQELAQELRDLLLEIGSVAVTYHLTPEQNARFDLTLQHPGDETYKRELMLSEQMDELTTKALNTAIAVVWNAFAVSSDNQ